MKLKEYIENLSNLIKDNKAATNYIVVTSSDDEGNSYREVEYLPSLGRFKEDEFDSEGKPNAVCVN